MVTTRFTVEDELGRQVTFDWEEMREPTEDDIAAVFEAAAPSFEAEKKVPPPAGTSITDLVRPAAPGTQPPTNPNSPPLPFSSAPAATTGSIGATTNAVIDKNPDPVGGTSITDLVRPIPSAQAPIAPQQPAFPRPEPVPASTVAVRPQGAPIAPDSQLSVPSYAPASVLGKYQSAESRAAGGGPQAISGKGKVTQEQVYPEKQLSDMEVLAGIGKAVGKNVAMSFANIGKFPIDISKSTAGEIASKLELIGWDDQNNPATKLAKSYRDYEQKAKRAGETIQSFYQLTPEETLAVKQGGSGATVTLAAANLAAFIPTLMATGGEVQAAKLIGAFGRKFGPAELSKAVPMIEKATPGFVQRILDNAVPMAELGVVSGEAQSEEGKGFEGALRRGLEGLAMGATFGLAGPSRIAQAAAGGGMAAVMGAPKEEVVMYTLFGGLMSPGKHRQYSPKALHALAKSRFRETVDKQTLNSLAPKKGETAGGYQFRLVKGLSEKIPAEEAQGAGNLQTDQGRLQKEGAPGEPGQADRGGNAQQVAQEAPRPVETVEQAPSELNNFGAIKEPGGTLSFKDANIPGGVQEYLSFDIPHREMVWQTLSKDARDQVKATLGTEPIAPAAIQEEKLPDFSDILDRKKVIMEMAEGSKDAEKLTRAFFSGGYLKDHGVTTEHDIPNIVEALEARKVPFSIVVSDVGNMGKVNKIAGSHPEADKVLAKTIGDMWAGKVKENGGIPLRTGGDELLEFWPGKSASEVDVIRAKIENGIREKRNELGYQDVTHVKNGLPTGAMQTTFHAVDVPPGKFKETFDAADKSVATKQEKITVDIAQKLGYTMNKGGYYVKRGKAEEAGSGPVPLERGDFSGATEGPQDGVGAKRPAKPSAEPVVPERPLPATTPEAPVAPIAQAVPEAPKATPDRRLKIQRGMNGSVDIVFPDKAHADLYAFAGRVRKSTTGKNPIPFKKQAEHLSIISEKLGIPKNEVLTRSKKYREQIASEIKHLDEGATFTVRSSVKSERPTIEALQAEALSSKKKIASVEAAKKTFNDITRDEEYRKMSVAWKIREQVRTELGLPNVHKDMAVLLGKSSRIMSPEFKKKLYKQLDIIAEKLNEEANSQPYHEPGSYVDVMENLIGRKIDYKNPVFHDDIHSVIAGAPLNFKDFVSRAKKIREDLYGTSKKLSPKERAKIREESRLATEKAQDENAADFEKYVETLVAENAKARKKIMAEMEKNGESFNRNEAGDLIDDNGKIIAKSDDTIRGEAPPFSFKKGESVGGKVLTAEEVSKHIDDMGLPEGLRSEVIVVASENKLPDPWTDTILKYEATGKIQALFDRKSGKIYVVADKLGTKAEIQSAIEHEAFGHLGVERLIGPRMNSVYDLVIKKYENSEVGRGVIKNYGKDGKLDLSRPDNRIMFAKEVLAHLAEKNVDPGFLKRVIAHIRQMVRQAGIKISLSDNDVRSLLINSRKAALKVNAKPPGIVGAGKGIQDLLFKKGKTVDENGNMAGEAIKKTPASPLPPATVSDRIVAGMKKFHEGMTSIPKFGKFKEAILKWDANNQELSSDVKRTVTYIRKVVPDADRRMAISVYREANEDAGILKMWSERASNKHLIKACLDAQNLSPKEKEIANYISAVYKDLLNVGMERGLIEAARENYVTHLVRGEGLLAGHSGKLMTNFKFGKERVFPTIFDADQAGYKVATIDAGDLLGAYISEMKKVINSRDFIASLLKEKAKDGRPLAVPMGDGKPIEGKQGDRTGLLVDPRAKDALYDDYNSINHYALTKHKWVGKDAMGESVILNGDLALHPEIYSKLKNVFGHSAIKDWYNGEGESLPNHILRRFVKYADVTQQSIKQAMLSLSAFHYVQEGTHAIGHKINPFFNIPKINLTKNKEQFDAASHGLRLAADHDSMAQFKEGMGSGSIIDKLEAQLEHLWKLPGIGKTLRKTNIGHWNEAIVTTLFESYIPGLKFKTYQQMVKRNGSRFAKEISRGEMTLDDVKYLSAQQSNAAYGHLNYVDMARNPTLQHFWRATLLAPDFLEARAKFVGQSLKAVTGQKGGREQLEALALLATVQFASSAIFNALVNDGDMKLDHPFVMVYKGRQYKFRSVPYDILHMVKKRGQFIRGRVAPGVNRLIALLEQKDFRGLKQTFPEWLQETATIAIPISLRAMVPGASQNKDIDAWDSFLNSMGVMVSRYSPLTEMYDKVDKWKKEHGIEVQEAAIYPPSKYRDLRNALMDGHDGDAIKELEKLMKDKNIPKIKVMEGFRKSLFRPMAGSNLNDFRFAKSLNEVDRAKFEESKKQRFVVWKKFMKTLSEAKKPVPKELLEMAKETEAESTSQPEKQQEER